jgi:hypothetical protein
LRADTIILAVVLVVPDFVNAIRGQNCQALERGDDSGHTILPFYRITKRDRTARKSVGFSTPGPGLHQCLSVTTYYYKVIGFYQGRNS